MMLRIGRMAATVPSLREGDRHARGLPPPDLPREMPDPRPDGKRAFRRGDRPPARAQSVIDLARDPAQRRSPGLPARPGAAAGRGAAQRGVVGAQEDDAGAVGAGGGAAGAGLEPGAGRRPAAPGGPPGGGAPVDLPARPRRPQGRGPALAAPAPPGKEAEPEGRGPRGPGPHPGPGGHPRAPGAGGGEGADRRPGGRHESTARAPAGPWCRWWTGRGDTRSCGGPAAGRRPRSGPP